VKSGGGRVGGGGRCGGGEREIVCVAGLGASGLTCLRLRVYVCVLACVACIVASSSFSRAS
jgi:hypothetical protein